jgi:hypothetical protein
MSLQTDNKRSKNLLLQYAGYATQMIVAIGAAVFLGMYVDKWLELSTPVFIWVTPLVLIIFMLVKVIVDTSRKK